MGIVDIHYGFISLMPLCVRPMATLQRATGVRLSSPQGNRCLRPIWIVPMTALGYPNVERQAAGREHREDKGLQIPS